MYCYNNRREPINEDGQKIIALKRRKKPCSLPIKEIIKIYILDKRKRERQTEK
jgi:hypothetical protein